MARTPQQKTSTKSPTARRMNRAIRVMEQLRIEKAEQVRPHVWRIQLAGGRRRRSR